MPKPNKRDKQGKGKGQGQGQAHSSTAAAAAIDSRSQRQPPQSASATDSPTVIVHTIDPDHYTQHSEDEHEQEQEQAAATAHEEGEEAHSDEELHGDSRRASGDGPDFQAHPPPQYDSYTHAASSSRPAHTDPSRAGDSTAMVVATGSDDAIASPSPPAASPPAPVASVSMRAVHEAAGGLGGSIFSACCVYPIDLVKTRMQLPNCPYTSLFGGVAQVWREEGLTTLYTGLGSELVKTSLQSFSYFYWYFIFKELAINRLISRQQSVARAAAGGLPEADTAASGFLRMTFLRRNSSTGSGAAAAAALKEHQSLCTDPACFCRSDTHLAAHTEAHKRSQVEIWREKALLHRQHKMERLRARLRRERQEQAVNAHNAHAAIDFDTNVFHPRMFPSVSEPSLAGLALGGHGKHDLDDSPYVEVKNTETITLVTNTATLIGPPATDADTNTAVATTGKEVDEAPTSPSGEEAVAAPSTTPQLSIGTTLLLGTMAGCLTQLVVNPVSVIQTRMMTQKRSVAGSSGGSAAAAVSQGFFSLAASILRDEGPGAFFAGILPAFILSTNPSIQFLVFDRLKSLVLRVLSQSGQAPRSLSMFESFVLGAFSKIVATVVTYPYIFAKIRLSMKGSPYAGTLDVIFRTVKYEGVTGLFAGIQAQLLKSVLGAAIMFMAKEKIADLVHFLRVKFEQTRKQQKQQPSQLSPPPLMTPPPQPDPTKALK